MTSSKSAMNKWEIQGLGKSPFKLVGFFSIPPISLLEANPNAYNNEMSRKPKGFGIGSCEVCGTPLINNFLIKSSCGKKFSVGCDCVKKTGDTIIINEMGAEKRKIAKEKRKTKLVNEQLKQQQELNIQRKKNDGLTDYELSLKNKKDLNIMKTYSMDIILGPVLASLSLKNGSFVNGIFDSINRGNLPSNNCCTICIDIYAKDYARKETGKTRGKVFNIAKIEGVEIANQLFDEVKQKLTDLES